MSLKTEQLLLSALFKSLSLDPETYSSDIGEGDDIKALCSKLLKSSLNDEVMRWVEFADKFPVDSKGRFDALCGLNEDLLTKSVILGNGTTPSEADVIVFAVIHASVINLQTQQREKLPNLLRWMDYIQHKKEFGQLFEKIVIEKPSFQPQLSSVNVATKQEDSNAKKASQETKIAEKSVTKKATEAKESTKEKKKPQETEASGKDEVSVSLLNIQVGLIRKAWKHPSADNLLVEEIDVGEAKLRQIVSGLAKFCTPDELTNRRVVLITNVKPGKLKDVMSEGLVLCASNEDHTVVEPLLPPEGAKIGERVSFAGVDGKPEDVLNPKKKQLEKITPMAKDLESNLQNMTNQQLADSCGEIIRVFSEARERLSVGSRGQDVSGSFQMHSSQEGMNLTIQEDVTRMLQTQLMGGTGNIMSSSQGGLIEGLSSSMAAQGGSSSAGLVIELGGRDVHALETSVMGASSSQRERRRKEEGDKRTELVRAPQSVNTEIPPDDGFTWKKYGQKEILGSKYPRGYYRCTHQKLYNCPAKKQVQRMDENPSKCEVIYRGEHICHKSATAPSVAPPEITPQHRPTSQYQPLGGECLEFRLGGADSSAAPSTSNVNRIADQSSIVDYSDVLFKSCHRRS